MFHCWRHRQWNCTQSTRFRHKESHQKDKKHKNGKNDINWNRIEGWSNFLPMRWQWSFFRSDVIPMFVGHISPSLMMRLFGRNHSWQCLFAIFLLNHQDRCFWGSLTIVWDYFQWSPTIGPAMWCLRYIAQVYIEHNGLMLSATPKSSEMISLSKGRKEKMG